MHRAGRAEIGIDRRSPYFYVCFLPRPSGTGIGIKMATSFFSSGSREERRTSVGVASSGLPFSRHVSNHAPRRDKLQDWRARKGIEVSPVHKGKLKSSLPFLLPADPFPRAVPWKIQRGSSEDSRGPFLRRPASFLGAKLLLSTRLTRL